MNYFDPANVAPPMGKFSHVAIVPAGHRLAFVSGQIGADATGAIVPGGCRAQAARTFENLEAVLDALGVGPDKIVKMLTVLVGDDSFGEFALARDEVFARWYPDGVYPAHSAAVVAALAAPELAVEIEAVVAIPE